MGPVSHNNLLVLISLHILWISTAEQFQWPPCHFFIFLFYHIILYIPWPDQLSESTFLCYHCYPQIFPIENYTPVQVCIEFTSFSPKQLMYEFSEYALCLIQQVFSLQNMQLNVSKCILQDAKSLSCNYLTYKDFRTYFLNMFGKPRLNIVKWFLFFLVWILESLSMQCSLKLFDHETIFIKPIMWYISIHIYTHINIYF